MSNYRYATGGQTYTCLTCGALVEEEARDIHDGWHAALAYLDDLDVKESHVIWHRDHPAEGGKPEGRQ